MLEKLEKLIDIWIAVGEKALSETNAVDTPAEKPKAKRTRKPKAEAKTPEVDPLATVTPPATDPLAPSAPPATDPLAPAPAPTKKEAKAIDDSAKRLHDVGMKYVQSQPDGEARLIGYIESVFKVKRLADLGHEQRVQLIGVLEGKLKA